jgi:GDP/UDP-N,N'-diacetylbacillosamine 2-epimerase (hydrolysing)
VTRIGILTSSRADYSIYRPLLQRLEDQAAWDSQLLVFGTHLSQRYGYTVQAIERDGYTIARRLDTMPADDSPGALSLAMAKTIAAFSPVWAENSYDLVLALGDRYEMFAAVASSVPFNIPVAHIAGGESTLGAIDDVFRHSITAMARLHFTTAEAYRKRVVELKGSEKGVYNTGALNYDSLKSLNWLSRDAFLNAWGIDITLPYILITVHPETVSYEGNLRHMDELIAALDKVRDQHLVVTMPNADTMGGMIRERWKALAARNPKLVLVESFGTEGYLTAMKHCSLMLGNTSSGFVEAAYFPKPVINLGERQRGRLVTPNIIECPFETQAILNAIDQAESRGALACSGIYGDGHAAEKIVQAIDCFLRPPQSIEMLA